ncbi:hypothetical protein SPBR_00788 [Sporothrix brasiliensis 5110]|uniref:RNase MRP protein 1 RNA binding domain-containing protein n=1 Tax=Sporothrix brasiliensis 5110 TaxID=1398154 RepID=A0A0C2IV97_9PEZI|nr:uncharacterized protein SPBR_00788 [Sporothrix brasiliensis 5110]KIH90690.1 hypothetical protein SPBR_00788 [Sporothrix brasiliensis 5110]
MATDRIQKAMHSNNMDTPATAPFAGVQHASLLTPKARYVAAAERVEEVSAMLHGLNRLHKNQHRVSTYWWPVFGQLRRHVRRLEAVVRPLTAAKAKVDGDDQSDEEKAAIMCARAVRDDFIPKAYLAFSRLIADRRFAQLGLLLMAILAQVHTALRWVSGDLATDKRRIASDEDDGDDDQIEDELADAGIQHDAPGEFGDDLGEVIARVDDSENEDTKRYKEHATVTMSSKPSKKRPRQEVDSDNDTDLIKSRTPLVKPSTKSGESESIVRSEKKRKVDEDPPMPRSKEITEAKETQDVFVKRDKNGKKEKYKDRDKSKKIKKRKKNGDEFDDLFSGLL